MNPHVETVNLIEKSLATTLKKNRDEKKYYENLLAIRQLTDKQKFVIEKTLDCISETIDFLEIFENILSAQNSVEAIKEIEINSDVKASSESSQKQKLELEQQNLKNSKIPSLNEFIGYAKSLEGYEPELDLNISKKYESWINNGWKNTSNRPISNWKSTLKSTLPYLKKTSGENSLSLQDIPSIKRPES